MNIPASRWYRVIEKRRSRRHFEKKLPGGNQLSRLQTVCDDFQPFNSVRSILVKKPPDNIFKGIIGSYGIIRGAAAFIAFVGNVKNPRVQEQLGYTGEGIILEAEALKLNTCWVGGSFRRETVATLVDIHPGESIFAISPVGYASKRPTFEERLMTGFGLTHRRKPLSDLVIGLKEPAWPKWMKAFVP